MLMKTHLIKEDFTNGISRTLTGNIGREPELNTFQSGKSKVELTVA